MRVTAGNQWVNGSKLRYESPIPTGEGRNWLLQSLNDYLLALRFVTDAAADRARLLADYNSALIRLEESKGTLLETLQISLTWDPCSHVRLLPPANEQLGQHADDPIKGLSSPPTAHTPGTPRGPDLTPPMQRLPAANPPPMPPTLPQQTALPQQT